MIEDTAALRPIVLNDVDLPMDIRAALGRSTRGRDSALQGPIRSPFGVWYLRRLQGRQGGKSRSRQEVDGEIREILY